MRRPVEQFRSQIDACEQTLHLAAFGPEALIVQHDRDVRLHRLGNQRRGVRNRYLKKSGTRIHDLADAAIGHGRMQKSARRVFHERKVARRFQRASLMTRIPDRDL